MVIKPPPSEVMSLSIPLTDPSCVAQARRAATGLAQLLGFREEDAGKVALVASEAASNIIQHAGRGELLIRPVPTDAASGVELLALDKGPGIPDIAQSLTDGYSTRSTLGTGLGAIKRQSDDFEIFSVPDQGTAILSRITPSRPLAPAPKRARLQLGVVCLAHPGEDVCGDAWIVHDTSESTQLMLVDGVGHGIHAYNTSNLALDIFCEESERGPVATLHKLHQGLKPTRGAVALLAQFDWDAQTLSTIGFGNIAARLISADQNSRGIVSRPGTLGRAMPSAPGRPAEIDRAQLHTADWPHDALFIAHSDGLSSRWSLRDYPGLRWRDPALIAGVLYRDYCPRNDDVTILVCRQQTPQHILKKKLSGPQ